MPIIYRTRKMIKAADLNGRNTLFGGRLLEWIDEECAVFAACQMASPNIVTKYISEINFLCPAYQGDIIEIGVETVKAGQTSLTLQCAVRDKTSKRLILKVERLVFVSVDREGRPMPHALAKSGKTDPRQKKPTRQDKSALEANKAA